MDFERNIWDRGFEALLPRRVSRERRGPRARAHTLALAAMMLGSVGGAALLGAAVVALVTPMSGRELRRKLSHALEGDDEPQEPRADYDSGEFVVEELEREEPQHHHGSSYPAVAQPIDEDDVLRALVENDLPS